MTRLNMISNPAPFILIYFAVFIGLPASLANKLLVPSQYTTIQDGIDAAVNGDTVLVAAGTYTGVGNRDIELLGKSIVVMSESGPEMTTIDCETKSNRGFYIHQGEDTMTVISGFTITNANVAVLCHDDIILSNCILAVNERGIQLSTSKSHIRNCKITNNNTQFGPGLYSTSSPDAVLRNCLIANNHTTNFGSGGGLYFLGTSSPTIINCTVANNSATDAGGGIWAGQITTLKLINTIVWGNTSTSFDNVKADQFEVIYSNIESKCIVGIGNLSIDPDFIDTVFHLAQQSPCVDAGHPEYSYALEPAQNATRINMGAYGNTMEATQSLDTKPTISSVSPASGPPVGGTVDTIRGRQFGSTQGNIFFGSEEATVNFWSDTLIACTTPAQPSGKVTVHVLHSNNTKDSLTFGFTYVGSAILKVPSQYANIQTAIDCASHGDTVLVAAGTYTGAGNRDIELFGKSIVVMSESGPEMTIIDCETKNNRGFYIHHGEDTMTVISGFTITNANVAVLCNDDIILSNCILAGNERAIQLSTSKSHIRNCKITNNSTQYGSGFYSTSCPDAVVRNCLIANNQTTNFGSGGGLYFLGNSSPSIINCTVANNSATDAGGGIWASQITTLKLINTIVWGNTSTSFDNVKADVFEVIYSNIESKCIVGIGNISIDPDFIDTVFHLAQQSPCVDMGHPEYSYDLEPAQNAARINMGAYGNTMEATQSLDTKPTISSVSPASGPPVGGTVDTIRGRQFGSTQGNIFFGSEEATVNFWSDTLIACTTPAQPSGKVTVHVLHSNNTKDSLTFGFTYVGSAILKVPSQYANIQTAIDCASNGDTVLVAAGTYTGAGNRDIELFSKSIVVMSESGPEMTIIDCETKNNRGFYIHHGEDTMTVISGFTITNANVAVLCHDDIILTNCIMAGNERAIQLSTSKSHIRNCKITDNSTQYGSGIYSTSCPDAVVRNCLVANNHTTNLGSGGGLYFLGTSSPRIINCTVANNSATDAGGGIWVASTTTLKLINTIVWGNTSPSFANIKVDQFQISYSNIEDSIYSGLENFSMNPRFEDPRNKNYHLKPSSTSIDRGDPHFDYSHEPVPNGNRINLGAYGNTPEATSFQEITTIDNFHYLPGCLLNSTLTLYGVYFGDTQQNGSVSIDNQNILISNWTDSVIVCTVPTDLLGEYDIMVNSNDNGSDTIPADLLITPEIQFVSGSVNGIWSASCPSTYVLVDNIEIQPGDTLVIEPGVTVLAHPDSVSSASITVYGTLIAEGTEFDPILFSVPELWQSAGVWEGLHLNMQNAGRVTILNHCIVEYASTAIKVSRRSALISECTVQNNYTGVEFLAQDNLVDGILKKCLIQNNDNWGIECYAFTNGSLGRALPIINSNLIQNNGSGGIYVEGSGGSASPGDPCTQSAISNPIITKNLLNNNDGYAIQCHGSGHFTDASPCDGRYSGTASPRIEGNIICDNVKCIKASTSPANPNHWLASANPQLINNTFWNNGPIDILAGDSTDITVVNSIFRDGIPSTIQTEGNGKVHITYSNFDSLYPGDGNISADPLYIDAANHDFSLSMQSPCIDTASNDAVTETLDYLGNPRIADGNQDDSARVDMGAIETPDYCPDIVDLLITQPSCIEGGMITIAATGDGTLEYSADNGLNWQLSSMFSGLTDGNYDIAVRLEGNTICTTFYDQNPVQIVTPSPPNINVIDVTQPTCQTAGSIVVNASGDGILEYSADNGANWQTANSFGNLADGHYNIVVRLQANATCITSYDQNPVMIVTPSPPNINVIDVTQPTCQTAGSIVVNASGDGILEYSADNGANWQTANTFSNLADGHYNIVVRLQANITCITSYDQNPVMIVTPSPPNINVIDVTQPTCQTAGSIVVNASGDGILEYSADNGANWQTANTFSNLADGHYNIVVRLQANITCMASYDQNPVMIVTPSSPNINSIDVTQPTCQTAGSIVVNASGDGILEYSADNGANWQTANTFSNLADGHYNIVVRLQANATCITSYDQNPVMIVTPSSPNINSIDVTRPTCQIAGSIVVNASGDGILEYSADNGANWQTANSFGNLADGHYNIAVRLQANTTCITSYDQNPVMIVTPSPPNINSIDLTQPTCQTAGSIVVNASGNGILEYSADNGVNWQTANTFSNLADGHYNFVVRLQANTTCITSYDHNPVMIVTPSPPNINVLDVTQPTCQTTGSIVVKASGDGILEYSADNGANWQTGNTFSNLADGHYNMVVRLQANTTCITSYDQNPVILNQHMDILMVDDTPIPSGTYGAAIQLSSMGTVDGGANVLFTAGDNVVLQPDFEVKDGGVLEVLIRPCEMND